MEGSPNVLADLALLLCPLVTIAIVALWRPAISVPIVFVAAQMFLPPSVSFDAPYIPPLDKDLLTSLGALIGCLLFRYNTLKGSRPGRGYDLFLALLVLGAFFTARTNADPLKFGPKAIPGMNLHDFVSDAVRMTLYWWTPFYLGRTVTKSSNDVRNLFIILSLAGAIYSMFLFVEMIMSPQLNRWIYGYHQSQFLQTIRFGGYRPKAFMRHGLNVALFMLVTVMAATALAKAKERIWGVSAWVLVGYLSLVLLLCKSAGAIAYALVFVSMLCFTKPMTQARFAALLGVALFSYPVIRALGWLPLDDILRFSASHFGADRAESLEFRLRTEAEVLRRAMQRMVFGWGGYARPHLHNPWTGETESIIDGYWVLMFGTFGLVGFAAIFGLLLLPVWRLPRRLRLFWYRRDRVLVAALGLMVAVYVMDLIPNSSIDPYLTFLVGALVAAERRLDPPPEVLAAMPLWTGPAGTPGPGPGRGAPL